MTAKYIYERAGSRNWWFRYEYPKDVAEEALRPRIEKSLGTSDRRTAELLAAKEAVGHLLNVQFWRNEKRGDALQRITQVSWTQTPGTMVEHDDGTRSWADEQYVTTFAADMTGAISKVANVRVEKRGVVVPSSTKDVDRALDDVLQVVIPSPAKRDVDEEILRLWISHKAVKPPVEREARRGYEAFRAVAPGKTFATATRVDGRKLAEHLFDVAGLRSQSVRKMVGHLRAAVNVALDFPDQFPRQKLNPFSGVVANRDDALDRVPLDDADMSLMRANLHRLTRDERLLWVLCATTGMRRSEAWQIDGETMQGGYRCIRVGSKTESSDRMIPLPQDALPYLPDRINGCLFEGTPKNVGKTLLRAMRSLGITDERKVLHSLRHRASTRLNGVEDSVRDAILGHDDNGGGRKRSSKIYFHGHPVKTVADAIGRIGLG